MQVRSTLRKSQIVDHVFRWWENDISVVPVKYMTKIPMRPWRRWAGKKQPKPVLESWFSNAWPCNLGVILSGGLCVVDFDDPFSYLSWTGRAPHLAESYTVKTGRGRHVYLWLAKEEYYTYHFDGGELKCNGIVVAPPSVHPSGREYEEASEFSRILGVAGIDDIGVRILGNEELPGWVDHSPSTYQGKDGLSTVEAIKGAFGIGQFLSQHTTLKPLGDGTFVGVCPFHNDSNPSLRVWPDEGRCYCHAPHCVAHRRTDVIAAAAYLWNISVSQAACRLAQEL